MDSLMSQATFGMQGCPPDERIISKHAACCKTILIARVL